MGRRSEKPLAGADVHAALQEFAKRTVDDFSRLCRRFSSASSRASIILVLPVSFEVLPGKDWESEVPWWDGDSWVVVNRMGWDGMGCMQGNNYEHGM